MSPYNTAGLSSEDSEEVATQIAKNCRRRQPHSHLTPPLSGTPMNIRSSLIFPYFQKLESLAYIFVADRLGLSSFKFVQWAPKDASFLRQIGVLAVQGHSRSSKVDHFGTNRKRVCDFLLVINSDFGPILHRFRDTAIHWLKIAYFSYPSLIRRPRSESLPRSPLEFRAEVNHEETIESWGSEDPMIVARVVLTQCQRVTADGQTDGRSDGRIYDS